MNLTPICYKAKDIEKLPAHKICTIESLYKKRKEDELKAAKSVAIAYYEKFHKKPDEFAFQYV